MRRFLCYFRLLILLTTATVIFSFDQADFSATLGQLVDNVLGAKQFKVISLFAYALGIVATGVNPAGDTGDTSLKYFGWGVNGNIHPVLLRTFGYTRPIFVVFTQ